MSKQPIPIKVFLLHRPPTSPAAPPSTSSNETAVSGLILFVTSALAAVLPLLPYDRAGANRTPAIIFNGRSSAFHAFLVSVMFAFSGAFSSFFAHKNKPKLARLCRFYSMVAMGAAVVILVCGGFSETS
ncbi:hypothetical protein U1Q18_002474 [Sarracenia purpurea var. burkii]